MRIDSDCTGAFHSNRNFGTFETGQMVRNSLESPRNVEFPKCEPFDQKLLEPNHIELKFQERNFRKFGFTSRDCLFG